MRNVAIHQQLETSLCNFHGLAAYREHLLGPLLATFKAVMRAWCPLVLDYLITGYLSFISAINPTIVPEDTKCKLVCYSNSYVHGSVERDYVSCYSLPYFSRIPIKSSYVNRQYH